MERRSQGILLLLTTWLSSAAGAQIVHGADPLDDPPEALYRRIEQFRKTASRLRVDGLARDWRDLPRMADPAGDAGGDRRRDLVAAAIAPTEHDLWVMLRTLGKPPSDAWVFYLEVDMLGGADDDFRIEVPLAQRPPRLRVYDAQCRPGPPVVLQRAQVAVRHVAEIRIPYREISDALPHDEAERVCGKTARPWVRIRSQTWDAQKRRFVDFGPTVASFRLQPTPYPLDSPLPKRPRPPTTVRPPMTGSWFVAQGAFGSFSHRREWAYDLVRLDQAGHLSNPVLSKRCADHYAWGQSVYSPVAGRIARIQTGTQDSPICRGLPRGSAQPNAVCIVSQQGFGIDLAHLRSGSVSVDAGDRITVGQQIGVVGNSGRSSAPHLHLAIRQTGPWGSTIPLAFSKVRVRLNPVADDPWARQLDRWEPREGLFVEAIAP